MQAFVTKSNNQVNPVFILLAALVAAVLLAVPLHAEVSPTNGSAPAGTQGILDVHGPIVVQPCGNVSIYGEVHNASNFSAPLDSMNLTMQYNSTHNASYNLSGAFSGLNITAPCTTGNATNLDNLTITTNSSDGHNKTIKFFVSNATNASIVLLGQKPPFALSSNNTVNVTYFNGSTPLANNRPLLKVFNSKGQEATNVQLYNLSNLTNSDGIIQYNISVGSNAAGTYAVVVDFGLTNFVFAVQSAFGVSFISQTTGGESRSSFAPGASINLIAKSRYANGTSYDLSGTDYLTAFVTFPNSSVLSVNLTTLNATTSPGVNNVTFAGANVPGAYKVRIGGFIQGEPYETFGQFDIVAGKVSLVAGSDFFQHLGDKSVILPGQSVRFNVLFYNNTDDSLVAGAQNGGSNQLNCSAIVLNGVQNLATGANVSWVGTPSMTTMNYAGSTTICALTVGVPNAEGDFRLNATLVDPTNSSLRIPAEGIVNVRTYGLRMHICPAISDFMPCGFVPFYEKNGNATFEFSIDNFSSGQQLGRSAFYNVTRITLRKFSFGTGSSTENANWTANNTYFLQYPQTDANALRLVLDLPDDNQTGPFEVELTVNTSGGVLRSREFFMVKGSTVEAHGGPSNGQGGFNPQISCNGTFTFFMEAFDLKTFNTVQGVKINGIKTARHVISGKVLDSTFLTNSTTNTTGSDGKATFNVTFNNSKNFLEGPYEMLLNISYNGNEDEAFSGFMCGSGGFDLFKPEGFGGEQQGPSGGPGGDHGGFGQSGISGFPAGAPPLAGASDTVNLELQQVGFGGQSQGGPGQGGPGSQGINGTLKVTAIKTYNRDTGSERTISADGTVSFNVSAGSANLTLEPANFSLTSWPQGFMELEVNLTNGSAVGVESGPSATGRLPGFESAPFRIFVNFQDVPSSVAVKDNVSVVLNVSTNVSTSGNNFTVRVRSLSGGSQASATLVSAVILADSWNTTADNEGLPANGYIPGAEQWNVTFTVPTVPSGPLQVIFIINNSLSLTNEFSVVTKVTAMDVIPLSNSLMQMAAFCTVLDDANENGTLQGCNAIRGFGEMGGGEPGAPFTPQAPNFATQLNFSLLNTTHNVSAKSGFVCFKDALNWSNGFGGPGQMAESVSLSNDTYVAVLDNATPGVFDTIVFNTTTNNLTIVTLTNQSVGHRLFTRFNASFTGLYAGSTEGCGLVKVINSSASSQSQGSFNFIGRYPVNEFLYVPYKVVRGSTALSNATVDILGLGNLTLGSNQFTELLAASTFDATSATTDSNGVAFVKANVSVTGEFMSFWKANATVGGTLISAFAKLQLDNSFGANAGGSVVQIAAFEGFCGQMSTFGIQEANQNVSVNCSATYFNHTPITGANFTLMAFDRSRFPNIQTTLTLYNATSGARLDGVLSGSDGNAEIKFTMPGNWTQGGVYDIMGTSVAGGQSQLLHAGHLDYFGGFSGGYQGPGGGP